MRSDEIEDVSAQEDQDKPETKEVASSFARLIDRITDSWFGPSAEGWRFRRRFGFSLAGSATFAGAAMVTGLAQRISFLVLDPGAGWVSLLSGAVLLVSALWFAYLVSWKDLKHGPARLYLSGLLLPSFVAFVLNRVFT